MRYQNGWKFFMGPKSITVIFWRPGNIFKPINFQDILESIDK
jgi:hypothetical protein